MKSEGAGGQKKGLGGSRSNGRGKQGGGAGAAGEDSYSDASFGGFGDLHPDAYLMSSYSASVPMIW